MSYSSLGGVFFSVMKRSCTISLLLSFLGMLISTGSVRAAGDLPLWDSAVNNLLAAGLYGVNVQGASGLTLHATKSYDLYKGLAADKARIDGQSITLSYGGSSGLLGFSAGYIYTSGAGEGNLGSVFLGLEDPMGFTSYTPGDSWYLALDLATSYQPHDDIVLGFSGKTMLMKDPYGLHHGKLFSFLLNMPVSYKQYITITPELQWSRPLSGVNFSSAKPSDSLKQGMASEDTFYGGVSISFSY